MAALTPEEIEAIGRATAKATAESLSRSIEAKVDDRIAKRLKTKFELMFGTNCEDEDERAEMRKDHEFLRDLRNGARKGGEKIFWWAVGIAGTSALAWFWPDISKHIQK